jgi:hypothetical protein
MVFVPETEAAGGWRDHRSRRLPARYFAVLQFAAEEAQVELTRAAEARSFSRDWI